MATGAGVITPLIFCRYCMTDTNQHLVKYFFADKLDKFEKILEDTFNMDICVSENKYICLECQKGIKNAAVMKKKILEVQKRLLEQSEKITLLDNENMEEEINNDNEDYVEYDVRTEVMRSGDCKTGENKVEANHVVQNNPYNNIKKAYVKLNRMENEKLQQTEKNPNKMLLADKKIISKETAKRKDIKDVVTGKETPPKKQNRRLLKRKKNTLTLFYNSNMCLFISRKAKYACFFCGTDFLDIRTLRIHSQRHKTDKIIDSIQYCRGQRLKNVDISNLECKKCSHPCKDLDELRLHLNNNHGETFEGTEHLLIPYKIEDGFDCVICQKPFSTYMKLSIHMNSHSTDNICDKCGVSFNSTDSLRNHIANVHTQKQCPICPSTFPTQFTKLRHLRITHNKGKSKRHCLQCDKTFKYGYILDQHMIDNHGAKKTPNICKYCNKEFSLAAYVNIHIQNVHLNMKKHCCSVCDMLFFTSYDRRRHEMTHGSEKPFSCDLCDIKFRSKDSMRRHLRRMHTESKIA